jgi:hypothetical protein
LTSPTEPTQPTEPTPPTPAGGTAPPLYPEAVAAAASLYLAQVVGPWLDAVRAAIFPIGRIIDPLGVLSATTAWAEGIRRWLRGAIDPHLLSPYRALFPVEGQIIFQQLPYLIRYNAQVRNLLVGVPDQVYAHVKDITARAIDEGMSIPRTAALVEETLLDANAPMWTNRATVVARTEVRRAQMGGLFGAYTEYGARNFMEYVKEWLDSDDTRVRPAHVDTDGQRRQLLQPFAVGRDGGPKFPAMYPLDPALPADLSVQCRCDMLIEEAGERMTDKSNRGFRG